LITMVIRSRETKQQIQPGAGNFPTKS
jgi:hypothetical protein